MGLLDTQHLSLHLGAYKGAKLFGKSGYKYSMNPTSKNPNSLLSPHYPTSPSPRVYKTNQTLKVPRNIVKLKGLEDELSPEPVSNLYTIKGKVSRDGTEKRKEKTQAT